MCFHYPFGHLVLPCAQCNPYPNLTFAFCFLGQDCPSPQMYMDRLISTYLRVIVSMTNSWNKYFLKKSLKLSSIEPLWRVGSGLCIRNLITWFAKSNQYLSIFIVFVIFMIFISVYAAKIDLNLIIWHCMNFILNLSIWICVDYNYLHKFQKSKGSYTWFRNVSRISYSQQQTHQLRIL